MTKAEFQVLKQMITALGAQLTGDFDSKLAKLQFTMSTTFRDELNQLRTELKQHTSTAVHTAVDSLRTELKQHTTDVIQEAMQTIGEHIETFQADYTRTKNDHELRILRLEQRTP